MKCRLEALERADQFITDHPITPAIPRATVLVAQLKDVIIRMTDHRNNQDQGAGQAMDGTDERALGAERLRRLMRKVSKMAKELDPIQFPGVRKTLRLPRNSSYHALEARAETFLTTVGPIKAAFVDRGLPGDFDELLQAELADFLSAAQRQFAGLALRVSGTAGLAPASQEGLKCVRELDSILFTAYENSPGLYAAWKSASRVQRSPQRSDADGSSATTPQGGASTGALSPAVG